MSDRSDAGNRTVTVYILDISKVALQRELYIYIVIIRCTETFDHTVYIHTLLKII